MGYLRMLLRGYERYKRSGFATYLGRTATLDVVLPLPFPKLQGWSISLPNRCFIRLLKNGLQPLGHNIDEDMRFQWVGRDITTDKPQF